MTRTTQTQGYGPESDHAANSRNAVGSVAAISRKSVLVGPDDVGMNSDTLNQRIIGAQLLHNAAGTPQGLPDPTKPVPFLIF